MTATEYELAAGTMFLGALILTLIAIGRVSG